MPLSTERKKIEHGYPFYWGHWLVIILSIVMTLAAWYVSKSQLEAKRSLLFERKADQVVELISERMRKYEDSLWGGVAFIHASGGWVDYDSWLNYTHSLRVDVKYPGINGIGVIYALSPEGVSDYLRNQQKRRPDFNIHPIHPRQEFYPITYIEPVKGNEQAVGLDIAFEENRFTAAQKARDSGVAQITGVIRLVQDLGQTPGFLLYAPFYRGGIYETVEDRRAHFLGMVYAPFVGHKLMDGVLAKKKRQVGIRIKDGQDVVYDEHLLEEVDFDPEPLYKKMVEVVLYGRTWTYEIWSAKSFRNMTDNAQPTIILFGGLFIDGLVLLFFGLISRANRRAIVYADRINEELLGEKEQLGAILRTTIDGFWIINRDMSFKYVNDAYIRMIGYSNDELMRSSVFDVDVDESPEAIERHRYAVEVNSSDMFETRHRCKDGNIIDVEISLTCSKDGNMTYAFLRDITDRKQMERDRIRLQRLRVAGELSAGVSHNLNNILVGVLGPADLLKMKIHDPDILQDVDDILNAGKRARDLVHRLHLSTRGVEEEILHAVNVTKVVEDAVTITRPRWKDELERRNLSIEIHTDLGNTPPIKGTASRLHDIFVNLLLNAVDAMPNGGTITIKTQTVEQRVEVTVSDTGIGMDEETLGRVFEPFFTTKQDVGSGLGLSTAYGAVTQWGGDIRVGSQLGKGTTFTMMFPVWEELVFEEVCITKNNQNKRPGKILIVDDDETVLRVLSRMLKHEHQVEIANSGLAALEMFPVGNYDVTLIDMGMPGMSGDKVLEEMHRRDPSIVSVLITGWALDQRDALVSKFDFRIQKPFSDVHEVLDVVTRAVALHDQRKPDTG